MTPKRIIEQIEKMFGRQSEAYMIQMMNDGLTEIASTTDLEKKKRWYELDDKMIDITKVEILDTNNRYVMIPKLADPHKLLRDDTDSAEDSLT